MWNSTAAYKEPEDVSVYPFSEKRIKTYWLLLFNKHLPVQYISLDGNSMTSTDLVNLGRGLYKIKVTTNKVYFSGLL